MSGLRAFGRMALVGILVAGIVALMPATLLEAQDDVAVAAAAQPAMDPLPARSPFPPPHSALVGGHLSEGDERSLVIFPAQRIDMFFNHRAHVHDIDVPCADCHVDAPKSTSSRDDLIPGKPLCLDCHDPLEVPQEWDTQGSPGSVLSFPDPHLRFSHRQHVEKAGIACGECHAGVDQAKVATREHLPSMETCVACHAAKGVSNDCKTCHVAGKSGTIRTSYPSGQLVPDDHGLDYLKRHGADAERDMGQCASCHAQQECLACHDGALPPQFHESNYLLLHPQEAMANSPACASCHRLERFCRDCHFRSGVTLGNPLFSFPEGFHPAGWMLGGDPDFHGPMARRALQSCTGCHAKQDCIACHAFTQGGPRIHPPGFGTSTRARRLREANPGLCLECHGFGEPGDPIGP